MGLLLVGCADLLIISDFRSLSEGASRLWSDRCNWMLHFNYILTMYSHMLGNGHGIWGFGEKKNNSHFVEWVVSYTIVKLHKGNKEIKIL